MRRLSLLPKCSFVLSRSESIRKILPDVENRKRDIHPHIETNPLVAEATEIAQPQDMSEIRSPVLDGHQLFSQDLQPPCATNFKPLLEAYNNDRRGASDKASIQPVTPVGTPD